MVKVLGLEFSNYDLADHEEVPTLVVKTWNDYSITLAPEFDKNQMFYPHVATSEDTQYRWYDKSDFQDMADEFNNDPDVQVEWKMARRTALKNLIDYLKKNIEEDKQNEKKYSEMLNEMGRLI